MEMWLITLAQDGEGIWRGLGLLVFLLFWAIVTLANWWNKRRQEEEAERGLSEPGEAREEEPARRRLQELAEQRRRQLQEMARGREGDAPGGGTATAPPPPPPPPVERRGAEPAADPARRRAEALRRAAERARREQAERRAAARPAAPSAEERRELEHQRRLAERAERARRSRAEAVMGRDVADTELGRGRVAQRLHRGGAEAVVIASDLGPLRHRLDRERLREAVILKELLDKPVAQRDPDELHLNW